MVAPLTHAARARGDASLLSTVAEAAAWLDERLFDVPRLLPGLCFGRSGTAWALYDAAELLGDGAMAGRAIALAERLPVRWRAPTSRMVSPAPVPRACTCGRQPATVPCSSPPSPVPRYRTRAEDIAAVIDAQHCESDGLRLVADATSGSEYGNGEVGVDTVRAPGCSPGGPGRWR